MVTRAYYESEEPVYGRYSGRGHGYPLNHDRDLPASNGPYGGPRNHSSMNESRNSGQSPDQEPTSSHPRRRIPVACGRCRKRKIRCSGDPGNGGRCSGCKAAGNELCQFLRVLSTEAPMKVDTSDFSYDSAPPGPRVNCRMVPYGPQAYAPQAIPLGPDGFPYRQSSLSYPYQGKGYYGIPSYGEFTEENIDYSLQTASYPILNTDHMSLGSNFSSIGRPWTPAPQLPKSSLLFLGEESAYGHAQMPYSNCGYGLRPTISPESKGMSMSGISNSLPALANSTDRVLPIQSHRTSFLRSSDGLPSNAQPARNLESLHPYSDLLNSNIMSSNRSLNSNSISENGSISSPYLALSNSSAEALPTMNGSQTSHQHNGLYHHNGHNRVYSSITTSSSEDLQSGSYGVGSPNSKRPSHGSPVDDSPSSPAPGDLANGRVYVPYQHPSPYPAPPLEMAGPVTHRGSDTSIPAGA